MHQSTKENYMPINLSVTLNGSCLDVDQRNNANHVDQNPNSQTITWQLTGNAASGSFNAMSAGTPGFVWVTQPAPSSSIFGTPTVTANGNQITMTDLNNSSSTAGTWIYKLTATVNGQQYSTTSSLTRPTATTNNPTIVNK
jgi:hypothetical protein